MAPFLRAKHHEKVLSSTVLNTNTGCLSVHGIVIIKEICAQKASVLLTGFAVSSSTYLIIANNVLTFETRRGIRGAQAKLVASHGSLVVDISGASLVKYIWRAE
ncbi:hypothetical protein IMY05_006G0036100 [Salix suchowensis]|nr:hypothetical protein IMY05_006G0036100 [Salix suchowensis]